MIKRRAFLTLALLPALGVAGCGGGSTNLPSTALGSAPTASALTGRIVYSQIGSNLPAGPGAVVGQSAIYSARADGIDARRLTPDNLRFTNDNPALSPDGTRVAFVNDNIQFRTLYTVNADGSDLRSLPNVDISVDAPAWSPDGQQLVYTRDVFFSRYPARVVYVTPANGQDQPRAITQAPDNPIRGFDSPTFSPDGKTIAVIASESGSPQIYLISADGQGTPRRVTSSETFKTSAVYSPGGEQVAFLSGTNNADGSEIRVVDVKTGAERIVPAQQGHKTRVSYSPDGRFLVYSISNFDSSPARIYITRADGSSASRLFDTGDTARQISPAWSR